MKKPILLIIITLISLLSFSFLAIAETPTLIERQEITINLIDKGLSIEEQLTYKNTIAVNTSLLRFSIPQEATQISILNTAGEEFPIFPVDDTSYEINLSEKNIQFTQDSTVSLQLTYTLPTNTETFQKTILYDTKYLTVDFNDRTIYQAENLQFNDQVKNSITLALYRPTEAPLSLTSLIIILTLVVIIILIMILLVRRKRPTQTTSEGDSKEILMTKKALYLAMLKDIEKQHRGKQISDDSYSKIKTEFKQQAVSVMQKLDDIKEEK
jgi:hypothetical protein